MLSGRRNRAIRWVDWRSPKRLFATIVASPGSVCTQSYLVVSPFASEEAALSFQSYYRSRLFRFIVSLRKITQHAIQSTYSWVPEQAWDRIWTDEMLYEKYGITDEEIEFIESMIRPMDLDDTGADA